MSLIELRRFRSLIDAEIARGFLLSHGLRSVIFDRTSFGYAEGFPVEVRLMVMDEDVDAALAALDSV